MIQIKRGQTKNWRSFDPVLAPGQPGYDNKKYKLKVGDGETPWTTLHYATGLFDYEILNSESTAKSRYHADNEDITVISYGTEGPDEDTVGKVYLQYYDADPEVDYIVDQGKNLGWTYQKYNSGIAKCFGTFEFETTVQSPIGADLLYQSANMTRKSYPFTFKDTPSESASVQSPSGLVWLAATKNKNSESKSASYCLISPDKLTNNTKYTITLIVEGFWK